ncbi:MAG TPA: hypothetical protein VK586_24625, partial [Streptosporangiaceae bacterium]|nr:hypothetical protein [Streptosporangiaceae bacterium]
GGRAKLVDGVLEVVGNLRADLPPATRDGLPPATLNGPVSPAQAASLAAVLDAFSDMTAAAADALSGPRTFSLPGTRGKRADPVEIEVHAGTNDPPPDLASTANFDHRGSFRLDGAVYHLYAAAVDYTITARSARLGVADRASRLVEQSLDPPAGITAPGPVVGAVRVEDGALWAVRHSDLLADGAEPPPPGDHSEMFLAGPDDDSLLPLPQHRVDPADLGDFKVLDVAYSRYDVPAARIVLAKEIRWNRGLSAFDAPGRPDDPRPGPKWRIAKDRKSWTSVNIASAQRHAFTAKLWAWTQPGTEAGDALLKAVGRTGRRQLVAAGLARPAPLPVPRLSEVEGAGQVEVFLSNPEIVPRLPGSGQADQPAIMRFDGTFRYSGAPVVRRLGRWRGRGTAVIVRHPYAVALEVSPPLAKRITDRTPVTRPDPSVRVPMLEHFRGEDRPPEHWRRNDQIGDYLSDVDLEQYRLQIKGGLILRADGTPFDTTGSGRRLNLAAFVMTGDDDGHGGFTNVRLYATTESRFHSSLSRGRPVIGVGTVRVRAGLLIGPVSGHYRPLAGSLRRVVAELRRAGVPISDDQVEVFPSPVPDGDVQLPPGYSIQTASDGIWLAAANVARRSIRWAFIPGQNHTVHIGLPDDEAAGRHVMTVPEARTYVDAVRAQPGRVALHFTRAWRANGQQWANTLEGPVVVPFLGEVTRTGSIDVRDDSGDSWRPAVRALVYYPARPGRAPEPPDVLAWDAAEWSLRGRLTKIEPDQPPVEGEWGDIYRFRPGGGLPEMTVEVMKSGLFARSGGPVDDALRAAALGVAERGDGWILQHAPGTSPEQLDALRRALTRKFRGRLKEEAEVVARPLPDPGITVPLPPGVTLQNTSDGAGLAAGSLPGIVPWAPALPGLTLHVGAPGDVAAGRPVPALPDAARLLRSVRRKLQPARVMLSFPVEDGQRWADTLQRRVLVPVAELAADGQAVLRDESGAEVPAMIRGLAYEPTRPGAAPKRPRILARAVPSWLDLETVRVGPGLRRLPGTAGGSDHYIQMTKSGPLLSKGRADDAALADADAAQPPAGRWYLHLHPTADLAVTAAVKAAIRQDVLGLRMTERPMEAAATAPASAPAPGPEVQLRGGGDRPARPGPAPAPAGHAGHAGPAGPAVTGWDQPVPHGAKRAKALMGSDHNFSPEQVTRALNLLDHLSPPGRPDRARVAWLTSALHLDSATIQGWRTRSEQFRALLPT